MSSLTELSLDPEGFLISLSDWSEETAGILALNEGIELNEKHWEIITTTRSFYQRFERSPNMRALCNFIKQELGPEKSKSIYLLQLFPGSPAKLVSKISGLPKPENCL